MFFSGREWVENVWEKAMSKQTLKPTVLEWNSQFWILVRVQFKVKAYSDPHPRSGV